MVDYYGHYHNLCCAQCTPFRTALSPGSCLCLTVHQVHMAVPQGFLQLRQLLQHLFLQLYLQCALSQRHPTLGVSPHGEARLGRSVPLVFQ